MKKFAVSALICCVIALCGCSTEKSPSPQQQIPAITLSPVDKEKLLSFQKEILNLENITDRAIKLAVGELKNILKGGEVGAVSLPGIIDKARSECLMAVESLSKKSIPGALPPDAKKSLSEGKAGLVLAYKAYVESFDAIKSFVADKNPMALLEYRSRNSQAQKLIREATDKFNTVMTAAGISQ